MDYSILYRNCTLCGHLCGVDRTCKTGVCKTGTDIFVARVGLHMWEEPIISGTNGSGTIFISGCSLGCVYCQNRDISRKPVGKVACEYDISRAMLELENKGAHNINLVTPTHALPTLCSAIDIAHKSGLNLPIVYNTSAYDTVEALKMLESKVGIYLPDLKYYRGETAKKLSHAENYPNVARNAIAEMVRQRPSVIINGGIMQSGVIVRVLLLPGHVAEAKLNVKYLYETYGNAIYISLMSQYTPNAEMPSPLNRRVTEREYTELVEYADQIGVTQAFVQDRASSVNDYIPDFDI